MFSFCSSSLQEKKKILHGSYPYKSCVLIKSSLYLDSLGVGGVISNATGYLSSTSGFKPWLSSHFTENLSTSKTRISNRRAQAQYRKDVWGNWSTGSALQCNFCWQQSHQVALLYNSFPAETCKDSLVRTPVSFAFLQLWGGETV